MVVTTPSSKTLSFFARNRLAGFTNYVRSGENVPHFFSRGSYYITRNGNELLAIANSCLHRGYKLVTERSRPIANKIRCPMHGRCYKASNLVTHEGLKNTIALPQLSLVNLSGFNFEVNSIDYRRLHAIRDVFAEFENVNGHNSQTSTIQDYIFEDEILTFYQVEWAIIMELMLDEQSIDLRHPGFAIYLGPQQSSTMLSADSSYQVYKSSDPGIGNLASPHWQRFRQEVERLFPNEKIGYSSLTLYPGLTVEQFPGVMVVTQLVPQHDQLTTMYTQLFYSPAIEADPNGWEFKDAFGDAFNERAVQRAVLQDFLQDGRAKKWFNLQDDTSSGLKNFEDWCLVNNSN